MVIPAHTLHMYRTISHSIPIEFQRNRMENHLQIIFLREIIGFPHFFVCLPQGDHRKNPHEITGPPGGPDSIRAGALAARRTGGTGHGAG